MKQLLLSFCIPIFLPALAPAQYKKPVKCEYAVEHPKYFLNPQGYFVVTGWPDTAQQRKVNDSLRAWFLKPTEFYEPKKPTAEGYKNYRKKKGETLFQYKYQCTWQNENIAYGIVLKDKDSVNLLGTSGYKGTGAHFCTWGTHIYDTNLLCIVMEYDPEVEKDTFEDPAFFHLQTGEMLHPHATLYILPHKKDSLQRLLMSKAIVAVKGYEDYRIDSLAVPDSIVLTDWDILNYYHESPVTFYFPFVVDGNIRPGQRWHARLSVQLTYEELKYFTSGKLEEQLDKFADPRK
jgi:hypothetical protein